MNIVTVFIFTLNVQNLNKGQDAPHSADGLQSNIDYILS